MKDKKLSIVGHRGAAGLAPENTVAAFVKALEYGVDMIETDCRVTADGAVVLVHNDVLTAANGETITVASSKLAELQARKSDLATLDDCLTAINRRARVLLDIKPSVPVRPIVAIIKRRLAEGWQVTDFLLASFDIRILKQLQRDLPEVERCVLESWSGVRAGHRCRVVRAGYVGMNQRWLWSGFIRAVTRRQCLLAYTLNDPRKAARWQRAGLYGVVTDYPDTFVAKKNV